MTDISEAVPTVLTVIVLLAGKEGTAWLIRWMKANVTAELESRVESLETRVTALEEKRTK